ncbi:MAG: hypothetical protein JO061_16345 [Acidobacteriaceae bacterium]|nr:hypothetical protein [Acidobacteriaceae bacterium]
MVKQKYWLWAVAAVLLPCSAAEVTLLTVGPFGLPVDGCQLEKFQSVGKENTPGHYSERFHGLSGNGIPLGEYDVRVKCGHSEIYKTVRLQHSGQFEVLTLTDRLLVADHVKSSLVVTLASQPADSHVWWTRLMGLYNGEIYTDVFANGAREASIVDPDPGSYVVAVMSTNGYVCSHQIDFVEFTRKWTFRPATCTFELDHFAHLVEESDRRDRKQRGWYAEMQAERKTVGRAIEDAAGRR